MPRILLLITDLEIGGTPTVVRELAVRLRAGGADVEVACLKGWGPVAHQLQKAGVPVKAFSAGSVMDLFDVVRELREHVRTRQIDTVFSFLIHANLVAAIASWKLEGVRWLQSIQTTQPRPRWHWWIQRIVQHAAEKIVVPSESVAEVARDWADVPPEKVVVIPNAVDSPRGASTRSPGMPEEGGVEDSSVLPRDFANQKNPHPALSRRTGRGSEATETPPDHGQAASATKKTIGFIGRLDPIKRVPDLIAAVSKLPAEVTLSIWGTGSHRGAIEAAIARHKLKMRVTLHGAIASPDAALQTIDVLVLPSAAEGFGLVLIEAMAAGVPVVATRVAGIRDVVRDEQTGLLVPVGDVNALAAAIARVLEDPSLRSNLIRQGQMDVKRRFTWDVVLPKYWEILNSEV